jgi:hypothetical protein
LWILASIALLGAATPALAQLEPADDAYSVEQGGFLDVDEPGVLANDCCGGGNTAFLGTGPAHGTFQLGPNGDFTYQHDGGTATLDTFTYGMRDRFNNPSETMATVTITITEPSGGGCEEEPPGGGGGEEPPPGGEEEPGDLGTVVTFPEVGATRWQVSLGDESLLRWDVDLVGAVPATVSGSPGLPTTIFGLTLEPLTVGTSAAVRELLLECHRLALLAQARPDTYDLEIEVLFPDTALLLAGEERLGIDVSAATVRCSLVRD